MPINVWTRSTPVQRDDSSGIFHMGRAQPRKLFLASFEKDEQRPPMGLLLGWEYGRLWLNERDNFLRETRIKAKARYIQPDFNWWLKKRSNVMDRRKLYRKRKQPQQTKNRNLTAFTMAKKLRQLRAKERELRKVTTNKPKGDSSKCTCKDCRRKKFPYNPYARDDQANTKPGLPQEPKMSRKEQLLASVQRLSQRRNNKVSVKGKEEKK